MKYTLYILMFLFLFVACTNNEENTENEVLIKSTSSDTLKALNKKIVAEPNNADLYYLRAKILLEKKKASDAMQDVDRALRIDSLNPDYLLFKSDLHFKRGEGRMASFLIEKSIKHNKDHVFSHLKKAEMLFYLNQYEKSILSVNDALRLDKYNAQAYFLKGMNYKYAGDTAKAVSSFQTAIEQNPEYYEAQLQLGVIFAGIHDPIAEAYYNNAIQIRPNSIEAIYNKSLFLQEHGKPDEAVDGYRYILKLQPDYQFAYYNIGYIKLNYVQEYDSAITYFNKALRINPGYFDAAYNIGYCYELKNESDIALKFYRKTLQLRPDHTLAAKGVSRITGN